MQHTIDSVAAVAACLGSGGCVVGMAAVDDVGSRKRRVQVALTRSCGGVDAY